MRKFDNQSGRSMIEMLGVLAIVGVLSVAGIQGYSKAMSKYKTNRVMDQVSTIAANVKTMFATSGDYTDLNTEGAATLALIPEDMTKTCGSATAPEGGSVYDTCIRNGMNGTVAVNETTTHDAFVVIMRGLNKETCSTLVTSDWGGAAGTKYIQAAKGGEGTSLPEANAFTTDAPASGVLEPAANDEDAFDYAITAGVCDCTGMTCEVAFVFY